MAIATYADLQTAVANWLHRADLTSIIPDIILVAEKRIYRDLRIRSMETALDVAIASGVAAVPSDYLDIKFSYVNTSPTTQLQRVTASQVYASYPNRSSTGIPVMVGREGANFIFGPVSSDSYRLKGIYYALPVSIQTSANAVFTANPDLYLFATLCEAAPYIGADPRIAVWEGKLAAIMNSLADQDADEYGSGGGLMVRAA